MFIPSVCTKAAYNNSIKSRSVGVYYSLENNPKEMRMLIGLQPCFYDNRNTEL